MFDNYVTDIELDGKPIQLALWDTAGQEEYERLRPLSYSKAHIILIAYSVDTPDSLDNVTQKVSPNAKTRAQRAVSVAACTSVLAASTASRERCPYTAHSTRQWPSGDQCAAECGASVRDRRHQSQRHRPSHGPIALHKATHSCQTS